MAILFNLSLWGSEAWEIVFSVLKQLEVFHLRCIRTILGIIWDNVRDENISNVKFRKRFNNIKHVELKIVKKNDLSEERSYECLIIKFLQDYYLRYVKVREKNPENLFYPILLNDFIST